jgi:hypothetical protein
MRSFGFFFFAHLKSQITSSHSPPRTFSPPTSSMTNNIRHGCIWTRTWAARYVTTSQPRKGDVTGCQFGALGACPVVPGGWPHPTGWGHPNHRRLPRKVPGTRGPTTARHIRCLRGMCEARGRSPPRRHCTPAPRTTTHWARLVRRAVPRAAPRAPGLASRKLIYSDPDLTHQRGLDWRRAQSNRF